MSSGQRPGGLTALGVINLIFGGFNALGILAMAALLTVIDTATEGEITEAMQEQPGAELIWVNIALGIILTVLLILSGIGYLGQKKVLGRYMGNAYGILGLIGVALQLTVQSFGIGSIVGMVYPVLTLIFINTTFKDDLVH